MVISSYHVVGACLGGGIRASGIIWCLLCEFTFASERTVDFIGGDMVKKLFPEITLPAVKSCVQEVDRSHYICKNKFIRTGY